MARSTYCLGALRSQWKTASIEQVCHPTALSCFSDVLHGAHTCCTAAVLGDLPLEDAATQMRKALALSLQLGKILSRHTSKTTTTDENQVSG